jgi:hypothetical protein
MAIGGGCPDLAGLVALARVAFRAKHRYAAVAVGARGTSLADRVGWTGVAVGAKRGGATMGIGASASGRTIVAAGAGVAGRAGHRLASARRSAALVRRTRSRRASSRTVGLHEATAARNAGRDRFAHLERPAVGIHGTLARRARLHVAGYWAACRPRRCARPAIEATWAVALYSAQGVARGRRIRARTYRAGHVTSVDGARSATRGTTRTAAPRRLSTRAAPAATDATAATKPASRATDATRPASRATDATIRSIRVSTTRACATRTTSTCAASPLASASGASSAGDATAARGSRRSTRAPRASGLFCIRRGRGIRRSSRVCSAGLGRFAAAVAGQQRKPSQEAEGQERALGSHGLKSSGHPRQRASFRRSGTRWSVIGRSANPQLCYGWIIAQ